MYGLIALNFIIPFVMVFVGYILKKHPVKDMTSGNGYNTPTSRKSQEHWDYAQSIAPNIFIGIGKTLGLVEIVLCISLLLLNISTQTTVFAGVVVGIIFLIFGFYKTETGINQKSTHNRRERPVCGHRGRSRGPFYYRITTFGKGPWDARDPHKTTFMALKHVIRLSIWQRQKETPGVEKAPGVSSPQRKESGRSGRDDGELRFGYDPAIHARRLRVYHRPRRLRMASRISIFFAARRFEPLNSMG